MRIKKLSIIGSAMLGLLLLASGYGYAYQKSRQQIDTIAELSRACQNDRDKDGYGNVTLAGGNFSNQKGIISVDCKLYLKSGSTLQMNNIQLQTRDFIIIDMAKDAKANRAKTPNHVILNHSTLRGQDANFQINLGNPASTVVIEASKLDYSMSLTVGVGEGDTDAKASLRVLGNNMRSTSPDSKGIFLVTTGAATFSNNQFELNKSIGTAVLLGETCEFSNNSNANDRCHGDQEVL